MLTKENFVLDSSTSHAFMDINESNWSNKDLYSVSREYVINESVDEILEYFMKICDPGTQYRVFYGNFCYIYNNEFEYSIRFRGEFFTSKAVVNTKFDDSLLVSGNREKVQEIINRFDKDYDDRIVPPHQMVEMVVKSANGLDGIKFPIKTERTFYPELYPHIPDPKQYIKDFLSSASNVLLMIGPPGLGKSAFINEVILTARVPTKIVMDKEVMKMDALYTDFIKQALAEEGGLMIMEDADNILSDRVVSDNDLMTRLLNLSDGIIDTSGAKFIFTGNIKDREDIDSALIRPGRCYDVLEFRNLTPKEAQVAANAVGKELIEDKDDYTVAEIFNGKTNRKVKNKVGFR